MTSTDENPHFEAEETGTETGGTEVPPAVESPATAADEAAETNPLVELEKWKDAAARATADLDNYRKRMAREKLEAIQYANRGLLEQLLPVIDNFEMGLKAAESSDGSASIILQGMAMVRKQLDDFLSEQGVEIIPSDGVAFDPNVHEALKQEPHAEIPEGHIIYTLRRGYRLKDRVLRAANVVVSSGPDTIA
ncbi:MAG: nucleotide exchange factor GrpE [Verrucomicrobiae bacterium]|nr:nucleotide exchange factor GrpE [Verrucomicrobiae bacterium]